MKTAFAVIILLIVCLLAATCYAQGLSRFQNVGGDFGQIGISSFKFQNPQPAGQNIMNDLWSWGGAPKGSIIVNGKLTPDPYYIWKSLNYTSGLRGKVYVDPYTGYPVYAYIDPYTGRILYFYADPNTRKLVYIYPAARNLGYGSVSPFYWPNDWLGGPEFPPMFDSNI